MTFNGSILTKLGMCIHIMEIWFVITNGQVPSLFDSHLPATHPYFLFPGDTLSKFNGDSANLVHMYVH